jgi:SanA protein
MKMLFKFLTLTIGASILVFTLPRAITSLHSQARIYPLSEVPNRQVAIVFGAGLWRDGRPTPVLRDRVITAVQLYFEGKVEKLLMSGDNSVDDYNEPAAMKELALRLGVPEDDIVLDYAGRRTYDTCYRAKHIFKVDQAILVTQRFHLPRALYLCNHMGLPAVGVAADQQEYRSRSETYWNLREAPATLVALWEVHVSRPLPVLGKPEPIFPQVEAQ